MVAVRAKEDRHTGGVEYASYGVGGRLVIRIWACHGALAMDDCPLHITGIVHRCSITHDFVLLGKSLQRVLDTNAIASNKQVERTIYRDFIHDLSC